MVAIAFQSDKPSPEFLAVIFIIINYVNSETATPGAAWGVLAKPKLSAVAMAFELNSLLFGAHLGEEYRLMLFRREVRNRMPLTVAIIRLRKQSLTRIIFRQDLRVTKIEFSSRNQRNARRALPGKGSRSRSSMIINVDQPGVRLRKPG
jgi:hypothetical protein